MLIDTNAYVAWTLKDNALFSVLKGTDRPVLPMIVVGELVYGAFNSGRPEKNMAELLKNLKEFDILNINRRTADLYGHACMALRKKGRHIPDNDIWIAALALQHGMPVVTRDKHFEQVVGLDVVGW